MHGLHSPMTIVARDLGTDVAGGSRAKTNTKLGAAKGTKSQGRKTLLFYNTGIVALNCLWSGTIFLEPTSCEAVR